MASHESNSVFASLQAEGIPYVVWKDVEAVSLFGAGNAELDLLVKESEKGGFERILRSCGYIALSTVRGLELPNIAHYLKFENDKYYHLHVYYRLRTGDHFAKEYLLPTFGEIFAESHSVGGIKVIHPKHELRILLVRYFLKQGLWFRTAKPHEVLRIRKLAAVYGMDDALSWLGQLNSEVAGFASQIIQFARGEEITPWKACRIKRLFDQYRCCGRTVQVLRKMSYRFLLLVLRASRRSNKRILGGGCSFAIIGADGSGKTTICDAVERLLKRRIPVRRIYLGGNSKTYSLQTRLYACAYQLARGFSPFKSRWGVACIMYYLGLGLLEYGKTKDRLKRIRWGEELKQAGYVVLYERYPIPGLFDAPVSLAPPCSAVAQGGLGAKMLERLYKRIHACLGNIPQPDAMFLIATDYSTIASRRALGTSEAVDINNKLSRLKRYMDVPGSKLRIAAVDNTGSLGDSVQQVVADMGEVLCKSR